MHPPALWKLKLSLKMAERSGYMLENIYTIGLCFCEIREQVIERERGLLGKSVMRLIDLNKRSWLIVEDE